MFDDTSKERFLPVFFAQADEALIAFEQAIAEGSEKEKLDAPGSLTILCEIIKEPFIGRRDELLPKLYQIVPLYYGHKNSTVIEAILKFDPKFENPGTLAAHIAGFTDEDYDSLFCFRGGAGSERSSRIKIEGYGIPALSALSAKVDSNEPGAYGALLVMGCTMAKKVELLVSEGHAEAESLMTDEVYGVLQSLVTRSFMSKSSKRDNQIRAESRRQLMVTAQWLKEQLRIAVSEARINLPDGASQEEFLALLAPRKTSFGPWAC